jgi:phosphoglycerol transferase MdoB-like AlkP superfamily enzyme
MVHKLEPDATLGRFPKLALMWTILATALAFTVRIDEARFSRERSVNELANNTFVSVLTAAITRNLDYAPFYPTLPRDEAYSRVRRLLATPDAEFTGGLESIQRRIPGKPDAPRLNLVLLLEESLGSEFWGSLGRKEPTLMPRMDAIATQEALLFDNLYADGNRTIRGYEGVFSSFPPLPGDSIVARDRSENVETIARVLARDGYDTTFLYAGRGVFDGTGPFVKANGWKNFIELKDFKQPAFTTIWGVCNEDLYDRVLLECRDRNERGLPFFVTSMSVSNHKPYTYPSGRIPEDPNQRSRANVVKYTDYALGRFFDMARKEPFWTNTIFVVVADHGARVYGSQTIPIHSYEIPMVIVGPAVVNEPRRVSTLGCQLDVAPTLLGLIGRPYDSMFFGHDLLKWPDFPGHCLLNHNRSVGMYQKNHLVVFSLNKKVEFFSGNPKLEQMHLISQLDAQHQEMKSNTAAIFQVADELYMNRKFRQTKATNTPGP